MSGGGDLPANPVTQTIEEQMLEMEQNTTPR